MKLSRNLSLGTYSEPRTAAKLAAPKTAAAARAAERARIGAVFDAKASIGRERAAARLLTESDMPAIGVIDLLAEVGPDPLMRSGTGKSSTTTPNPAVKASWNRTFARLGWSN